MRKIALVTDTACDLPAELFGKYNIARASMRIHFGDEEYVDQVTISHKDFYDRMLKEPDALPRTTQPQTKDYLAIFESLKEKGYDTVICLPISSKMSGSLQAAKLASEMINDLEILCVDTKQAGPAQGLFVYAVAKELEKGPSLEELKAFIDALLQEKPIIEIFITVESMKYLMTNGRIGRAKGHVVDLLNIKPILTIADGEITVGDKARGEKGVTKKFAEIGLAKIMAYEDPLVFFAWGADKAAKMAEEILKDLKEKPLEILNGRLTPTVACHSGPMTFTMTLMDKAFFDKF